MRKNEVRIKYCPPGEELKRLEHWKRKVGWQYLNISLNRTALMQKVFS
jgi:hypothetical protein